ncbi:MAG: ABC transporter ATP-binding protein [bacterium]|nr:ABC transporter ATP-binding protein [bacterium]
MSELTAHDVRFGFDGQRWILRDLDFSISTGKLVVILGENGSGKTTLLRILAGLLAPTQGVVRVGGSPVRERRGAVGMVLQNPDHQMIAATVEEEIALGCELRGMERSRMKRVVASQLARFRLEPLRFRPPESLSGGQKQRVALAAAMAAQPEFLLLDEPDSFLDAPSRREFLQSLDEVRADCGIVWVTPRPRPLLQANRCLKLNAGTLIPHECTAPSVCSEQALT